MGSFWRYFGHPLVVLAVALAAATGLLGYSGTGPIEQTTSDEYPISLAMRGELEPAESATPVRNNAVNEEIANQFKELVTAGLPKAESEPTAEPEKKPQLPTITVHRVAPGENLYSIAAKYGIDVNTILGANDLEDINTIRVGQELRILSQKGVMHRISRGENLWEIARKYKVSIDDIIAANGIEDPRRLAVGEELFVPGGTPVKDINYYRAKQGPQFIWPVKGRISSKYGMRWGRMHYGIDIAVITGTRVKAAESGWVKFAGYSSGYGYLVILGHKDGYETRYAHNSKLLVKTGQRVQQGQVIALSGNTGRSTGPHLHFEIRKNGRPLNPLTKLD
ncbi:MAG: peptidoglycan DD-metalloendopeptidase family protein [Firmicutes bacterium]|nr:peptidoglycan DD-metalloendopeptidase family protein [Bacillota bacterium]